MDQANQIMKTILLCNSNYNQIALANKLAEKTNLVGIVVETKNESKEKRSLKLKFEGLLDRTVFFQIRNSWIRLQNFYQNNYPGFPETNLVCVENINSPETINFISKFEPDLIAVSGTRIIKREVLNLKPTCGIVNLHTGLSPYIKGGPNCTNWCIALNKFNFIGNTVMWINSGIDSGNIITTEQTRLIGNETLFELHIKVMEHAHDLYLRSIKKIETGLQTVKSIPQNSITKGETYYTRNWNWKNKLSLLRNIKLGKKRHENYQDLITIPL